jgi:uncharacterized protein
LKIILMTGEKNLEKLLREMKPVRNDGDYVFCTISDIREMEMKDVLFMFREKEGVTIVIQKELADRLKLNYSFVAAWITLTIHSSLEATGFTAAFSKALAHENISCNVVAAYYHDHIFVNKKDTERAIAVLNKFQNNI